MNDLPEPMVPANVDLNGYGFMPLYGDRLFGSDFNAKCSDAEWRAGVTLWWASWKQVPAASLPDDDIALARLADLGRDVKAWRKLRANALRGFIKCADGRLYHKVIAEVALAQWEKRKAFRDRTEKARAERARQRELQEQSQRLLQKKDASVTVHKGEGEGEGEDKEKQNTFTPKANLKTLLELGVDEQVARDWLKVRKAKRAPLTDTALDAMKLEASRAGISLAAAVEICAKRGWQGFKASWNWGGKPEQGERRAIV